MPRNYMQLIVAAKSLGGNCTTSLSQESAPISKQLDDAGVSDGICRALTLLWIGHHPATGLKRLFFDADGNVNRDMVNKAIALHQDHSSVEAEYWLADNCGMRPYDV